MANQNIMADKRKLAEWLSVLVGIVLLVSGFLKALDSDYFTGILSGYNKLFTALAPVIVFLELFLGLLLTFNIKTKWASLAAFITIVLFTVIYTYGYLFLGIDKCGCFGELKGMDSPVFLYVRNAVLCAVLLFVFFNTSNQSTAIQLYIYSVGLLFVFVAAFIAGKNLRTGGSSPELSIDKGDFSDDMVAIKSLIELAPDSTYLVSFFSYSCPHCINSMGNLAQYKELGVVDRIIGFSMADSLAGGRFKRIFNPRFEIVDLPRERFLEITNEFPVSYIVSADTIAYRIKGELPSAFFLHD